MAKIILIDDNDQVRAMLQTTLERAGYEVEALPDGEVAVDIQRERPADLVITDILMPKKEGFETITELKRDFPDLKIIAISGGGRNDPDQYLEFAKTFGADRAFPKPLNMEKFIATIQELLTEEEVA